MRGATRRLSGKGLRGFRPLRFALASALVFSAGLARHTAVQATELEPCSNSSGCHCPNNKSSSSGPYLCQCPGSDHPGCSEANLYPSSGPPVMTSTAQSCVLPPSNFCSGSSDCYFTFVVIPDTQHYTQFWDRARIFDCETEWIKAHASTLKGGTGGALYVLHEGDVVNTQDDDNHWTRGKRSMCVLSNASPQIPYALGFGNQDGQPFETGHEYFTPAQLANQCGTGKTCTDYGTFDPDNIDYSWQTFNACSRTWMPLAIRWKPDITSAGTSDVDAWLSDVMSDHQNIGAFLVTHSFIDPNGTSGDLGSGHLSDQEEGEVMWPYFVKNQRNLFLTFNGHWFTAEAARAYNVRNDGRRTWSLFSNFQNVNSGDPHEGAIAVVNVCPTQNAVRVSYYSPWRDECITGDAYAYQLTSGNGVDLSVGSPGTELEFAL